MLPRPQLAPGVPRGLLGLVLAVLAGAAVAFLGRDVGGPVRRGAPRCLGAVLGGVAALVALVASYLVVEATAAGTRRDGDASRRRWVAGGRPGRRSRSPPARPVALALQTVL